MSLRDQAIAAMLPGFPSDGYLGEMEAAAALDGLLLWLRENADINFQPGWKLCDLLSKEDDKT